MIGRGGPAGRSPFGGRGGNMNNLLKKLITTNSFMLGGRGASFGGRGGSPGRGNYKFNSFFYFYYSHNNFSFKKVAEDLVMELI